MLMFVAIGAAFGLADPLAGKGGSCRAYGLQELEQALALAGVFLVGFGRNWVCSDSRIVDRPVVCTFICVPGDGAWDGQSDRPGPPWPEIRTPNCHDVNLSV